MLLASCATGEPAGQCLPLVIPARATWHPVIVVTIPKCGDCQQVWARAGDAVIHAVLIRGLVGVVSADVGGVAGPTWEDPGVLVPGIPNVRPQPEPRQSCQWQQFGEGT